MKKAGAKNDGCWARTNRAISKLTADDFSGLVAIIKSKCMNELTDAHMVMQDIGFATGTSALVPDSWDTWVTAMLGSAGSGGIPRSVWMGRLPYTVYVRSGTTGNYTYKAKGQKEFQDLGEKIRKTVREYIFAMRELKDLGNVYSATDGNPSGVADSHLGT